MCRKVLLLTLILIILMGCSPPVAERIASETVIIARTVTVKETVLVPQTVVAKETVWVVVTTTPIPSTPTPKITDTPTKVPTATKPPTVTRPPVVIHTASGNPLDRISILWTRELHDRHAQAPHRRAWRSQAITYPALKHRRANGRGLGGTGASTVIAMPLASWVCSSE